MKEGWKIEEGIQLVTACPICGGKAIPYYKYPSKRSVTYSAVKWVCTKCGYEGKEEPDKFNAYRQFKGR